MKKKLLVNNNQLLKNAKGIYRYFNSIQPYITNQMQLEMLFNDIQDNALKRKLREQAFLFNSKKYDVLWSPSHASGPYWAKNQVVTVHDLIPLHPDAGVSKPYKAYFRRSVGLLLQNATHVVCISATVADMVQVFFNIKSSKISVIRNGFDIKINLGINNCPDVVKNIKYIMFVGTLGIHKNLDRLIEAFLMHKRLTHDNLVLVLVGSFSNTLSLGKVNFDFEELKTKGILFFNNPDDAFLTSLYINSHGLVMPSLIEGFGLPIVEALCFNKPVICSDIGVFRELFGGIIRDFFNPYSIESIQQAIQHISLTENRLKNDEMYMFIKASKWNWESAANLYLNTFNQIAS
jgi:glycosyltransferase involved in cell wall biosynthesis